MKPSKIHPITGIVPSVTAWVVGTGGLVHGVRPVPEQFFLGANLPNPFNPGTVVPYGLAGASLVLKKA